MSEVVFIRERARAMIQSTDSSTASASVGNPSPPSTSVSATTPASGTPATPIAATTQYSAANTCAPRLMSTPMACVSASRVKPSYRMMPSLFRLVPTQAASVEARREMPSRSSARSVRGSATRLLLTLNA